MSKTTRATQALEKLGVKFTLHTYDYDPDADSIGLQAAEALGVEPRRMLKTLMAEVDGKPVCVVVPSDREVSMKKLAVGLRGKAAKMMRPADAERLTGYHVGGISAVRAEEARAGRDRGSRARPRQRVPQWRAARPADRARSQRCGEGRWPRSRGRWRCRATGAGRRRRPQLRFSSPIRLLSRKSVNPDSSSLEMPCTVRTELHDRQINQVRGKLGPGPRDLAALLDQHRNDLTQIGRTQFGRNDIRIDLLLHNLFRFASRVHDDWGCSASATALNGGT